MKRKRKDRKPPLVCEKCVKFFEMKRIQRADDAASLLHPSHVIINYNIIFEKCARPPDMRLTETTSFCFVSF